MAFKHRLSISKRYYYKFTACFSYLILLILQINHCAWWLTENFMGDQEHSYFAFGKTELLE